MIIDVLGIPNIACPTTWRRRVLRDRG